MTRPFKVDVDGHDSLRVGSSASTSVSALDVNQECAHSRRAGQPDCCVLPPAVGGESAVRQAGRPHPPGRQDPASHQIRQPTSLFPISITPPPPLLFLTSFSLVSRDLPNTHTHTHSLAPSPSRRRCVKRAGLSERFSHDASFSPRHKLRSTDPDRVFTVGEGDGGGRFGRVFGQCDFCG